MSAQAVYWHLPGFYINFYLYQVLIRLMETEPEKFHDGYRIGSVYGTFPGAIWNGGRAVLGISNRSEMETIIGTYNKHDIPVRFTWTNSLLTKEHCFDTYCNLIMKTADNGKNQVLVNTDVLESYLRENYPGFAYISSTTKRIVDPQQLREELEKDYFLVVLDYDLNHDEDVLESLKPYAERIEILADEICFPGCPKRKEHYREESLAQLTFDKGKAFPCPNRTKVPSFGECTKRPAFVSRDMIPDYLNKGYHHFKLVGRGLPQELVIESLLYFLVKPEYEDGIREKIRSELSKILKKR